MIREFTVDEFVFLLLAARWTLALSLIALIGGGSVGLFVALARASQRTAWRAAAQVYIRVFQGTPLLMQLFLLYFGANIFGVQADAWTAAALALTLYCSAFLGEIWRGCVDAIGRGQWEASASLGMKFVKQMRYVILPQALKIAVPPTVGFLVQLVKSTALASIVGFNELIKAGQIVTNATFQPVVVYGLVALIYFCMCFPLTYCARLLERKLSQTR